MSLQEAASQAGRRATKFCPANVQKIKDFVAQGMCREDIAKSLDVTVGSLQVTCSRLGISLRRHVLNGNASHPPTIGHMRVDGQFQISLECSGMRRATAIPLTADDIAQLALLAGVRNVGMTQLLTEAVATAIKKGMIEEILGEPSQEPGPRACGRTQKASLTPAY